MDTASRESPQRFEAVAGLRVRDFEDASLVFNPVSWDAHLLNPTACLILELCMDGTPTPSDVEGLLHDALEAGIQEDAARLAALVIDELSRLGLIKSLPRDALG